MVSRLQTPARTSVSFQFSRRSSAGQLTRAPLARLNRNIPAPAIIVIDLAARYQFDLALKKNRSRIPFSAACCMPLGEERGIL